MRKRYVVLLALAIFILVTLSVANAYLAYKSRDKFESELSVAIQSVSESNRSYTNTAIEETISRISVIQGPRGEKGASIVGPQGKKGESVQGPIGLPGVDGKNGTDGKGEKGDPGEPGREIEIRHDGKTEQLQWRYSGDDLWTTLVRDCEIINTCEDNGPKM